MSEAEEISFGALFSPLTTLKACIILVIIGFIVFANSLFNPFIFDDVLQITYNPFINSIGNIPMFFWNSVKSPDAITGIVPSFQYKPLFFTTNTIIVTLFGFSSLPFHILQLSIHIANSILLFLIFSKFIKRNISLILSLLFLIHPINTESVIYIANLQDVQFLFFGLLALAFLMMKGKRGLTPKTLIVICAFLLCSLLSKNTGILFLPLCVVYVFLFSPYNSKKMNIALGFLVLIYTTVALISSQNSLFTTNPSLIQRSSFQERMMTMPSIFLYYIVTFFFPTNVTTGQQWLTTNFSIAKFYLPLLISIIFISILFIAAWNFYKKKSDGWKSYIFFLFWFCTGMLLHLQVIPLDLTVATRWFYFPIIGLLGLLGVFLSDFLSKHHGRLNYQLLYLTASSTLIILSILTIIRNSQWRNPLTLYAHDIRKNPDSPLLNNLLGIELLKNQQPEKALSYLEKAVILDPNGGNRNALGIYYMTVKNYKRAKKLYLEDLQLKNDLPKHDAYRGLVRIYLAHENQPKKALLLAKDGVKKYPKDTLLNVYFVASEYFVGNRERASHAAKALYRNQPNELTEQLYLSIKNNTLKLSEFK